MVSLLMDVSSEMIHALLPVYLTEEGTSIWLAGAALSIVEAAGIAGALAGGWLSFQFGAVLLEKIGFAQKPIRVGVLHSLSGTMAISETTLKDTMLMLVEEQNKKGGLLGRPLEAVVVDPASNWPLFAEKARELIEKEKVAAVFGCWTSASRKTVKPVFEKYDHLLFYPVQYEGLEQSPNIVYTGAAPNQQIIPAVKWCFDNLGKKFFLVGSDYVFPRTANANPQEFFPAT